MRMTSSERTALVATSVAAFLAPFAGSSLNVALPALGRDLDLGSQAQGWIATIYLLAAAMFLLPFGRLADIIGRRRIFLVGLVAATVTQVASALAPSYACLLAARALNGLAISMTFGTGVAILTSVFRPERRGQALGVNVGTVYVGLACGPFIGGVLTEHLGWRAAVLAPAALALLATAVTAWGLRGEWAEARGEGFDLPSAGSYALGLGALVAATAPVTAPLKVVLALIGLGLMALFAVRQVTVSSPLLNVRLLAGNHAFALSNLAALINYASTNAVGFILTLSLQQVLALSPRQAGLVLLVQPVVQALLSPLAGRLSDRWVPGCLASVGMGITVLGLVGLALPNTMGSVPTVATCLAVLGLGFALFSSPNTNAVMSAVDRPQYGIAASTLGTMRLLGQMLSMALTVQLLAALGAEDHVTPQAHQGFTRASQVTFTVLAALCVLGVGASLARNRRTIGGGDAAA